MTHETHNDSNKETPKEIGKLAMFAISIDQPRTLTQLIGKAAFNGVITAGVTVAALEVRDAYKRRKSNRPTLSLAKNPVKTA